MGIHRLLLVIAVAGLAACTQDLLPGQQLTVDEWLSCEECEDGEIDAVRAIGPRAGAYLEARLEGVSDAYEAELRHEAIASYQSFPGTEADSAFFVDTFVGNAVAVIQKRAATALVEIGEDHRLENFVDRTDPGDVRPDVWAHFVSLTGGGPAPIPGAAERVRFVPSAVWVEVGDSTTVQIEVYDATDVPVPSAATWTTAGGALVTITPFPNSARIRGDAAGGPVWLRAEAAGTVDSVSIHVALATDSTWRVNAVPPIVQRGPAGSPLDPFQAHVVDAAGQDLAGVDVEWSIPAGQDATFESGLTTEVVATGATGRSSIRLVLGSSGARQVRVTARISTRANQSVGFRGIRDP